MEPLSPKLIRRRILLHLYQQYLADPLHMVTPEDILDKGLVPRDQLAPNAYYLHDRGLVELMVGYKQPLFAATRISPKGIDLVEDTGEFNRIFPEKDTGETQHQHEILSVLLRVAEEADQAAAGVRREWLLRDLRRLRDELRMPVEQWHADLVKRLLRWLDDYFDEGAEARLPSLRRLKGLLSENFNVG